MVPWSRDTAAHRRTGLVPPARARRPRPRAALISFLVAAAVPVVAGCGLAPGPAPTLSITLQTLGESGVGGTVTFTDLQDGRVRVDIKVEPAGHRDMPAHIHPGSCAELVPQPRYPLENVRDGRSITTITATTAELLADDLAVNLHASVQDLATYTACADIR